MSPSNLLKYKNERDFQDQVLASLRRCLDSKGIKASFLEPFGLDVGVVTHGPGAPRIKFLEFKLFAGQRMNGMGFGNRVGSGPQVDLLLLPDAVLAALDDQVRWCFADLTSDPIRYSLLKSSQARQFAMGGVCKGKQNNFRVSECFRDFVGWDSLIEELGDFIDDGARAKSVASTMI